jgi:acyl-CoA synthetase (AMP-forming)/AMP-acid ligase II
VIVTHANLLHNQQTIQQAFGHTEQTIFVGWLPLFHDMGLIGNVLQPLYLGIPSILMPPLAFLQRPWRWLEVISRYRATTSGAPNFAYDLCVRKTTPEQRATFDLSCWEVAFNGAEPVRAETMERFAATFATCGFRPEAFYPCYGLAEATLFITGGTKTAIPAIQTISSTSLAQNRAVSLPSDKSDRTGDLGLPISLVSCGQTWGGQVLKIVQPDSLTLCPPGEVGEIWLSGARR